MPTFPTSATSILSSERNRETSSQTTAHQPSIIIPPVPLALVVQKPKLLDQVRKAIRLRHYSVRTEDTYLHWIKRFIFFHNKRHPRDMGETEIGQFLSHLATDKHVSAATQNQALNALLFLYRHVLDCNPGWIDNVVRAKRPQHLPVVLTKDEVKALLGAMEGVPWLIANLLYGAGLRLIECLRLRVKDLDFAANQIIVREGKGNKDRITMFPAVVKLALTTHLARVHEMHQRDLQRGLGRVLLPDALARKYPNADKEWGWQWVFLRRKSAKTHVLERGGNIISTTPYRRKPLGLPGIRVGLSSLHIVTPYGPFRHTTTPFRECCIVAEVRLVCR